MTTRSELGEALQHGLMPAILESHGVEVEYDAGGGFEPIMAAPLAEPIGTRPGSEAVGAYELTLLVSEEDVEQPEPNSHQVKIPGYWVGRSDSTVTRRVAAILGDRAHGGAWQLGIAGGR